MMRPSLRRVTMRSVFYRSFNLLTLVALLAACEFTQILPEEKDSGPERPMSVAHIAEPVPVEEPRTIAGNRTPYRVLGKTYHVMDAPEGYKERGVASWYGRKFHGRRTSNGEIYDMYAMTAAHKSLPIPSYVKVTNLNNRRSVIVRVNDRGPFHGNRIIDLTYTAAKKLGFENRGTAEVEVEYIDPVAWQRKLMAKASAEAGSASQTATSPRITATGTIASTTNLTTNGGTETRTSTEDVAPAPVRAGGYQLPANTWLQVGAFSLYESAQTMQNRVQALTQYPVRILEPQGSDTLYRVRIGPVKDNFDILEIRRLMKARQLPDPHLVYED